MASPPASTATTPRSPSPTLSSAACSPPSSAIPNLKANTLFVFVADHGESLGEHGYWGHGRNLYEPTLRIPLGMAWAGKIRAGSTIDAPASILDVAPTLLGLAGLPSPPGFQGFDWTPVLMGAPPPRGRALWFEAHKGAVLSTQEAASARRNGLLAVGVMVDGRKQILTGGAPLALRPRRRPGREPRPRRRPSPHPAPP